MAAQSLLNFSVLRAAAVAFRSLAKVAVEVGGPGEKRVLFFEGGQLVAATSDSPDDRLDQQLVREGQLDPSLLEPIQRAARENGRLFGVQLLVEGLLRPHELAAALERQVLHRFRSALTLEGPVLTDSRPGPGAVVRHNVGALIIDLFRTADPQVVDSMTSPISWPRLKLAAPLDELERLRLRPGELRAARLLASGRARELPRAEPGALRLVAGLAALGLLAC